MAAAVMLRTDSSGKYIDLLQVAGRAHRDMRVRPGASVAPVDVASHRPTLMISVTERLRASL